jgi:hypothetical protein
MPAGEDREDATGAAMPLPALLSKSAPSPNGAVAASLLPILATRSRVFVWAFVTSVDQ